MDKQKSNNFLKKQGVFDARLALICACFASGALVCVLVFNPLNDGVMSIASKLGTNVCTLAFFASAVLLAAMAATAITPYAPVAVAALCIFGGAAMCFMSHFYSQAALLSAEFLKFAAFCFAGALSFAYVSYNALAVSARLKILMKNDRSLKSGIRVFSVATILLVAAFVASGFFCL